MKKWFDPWFFSVSLFVTCEMGNRPMQTQNFVLPSVEAGNIDMD